MTDSKLQVLLGSNLQSDLRLERFSTMRIGGPADFFYDARSTEDIIACVEAAKKCRMPVTILGGGTNTLISDKGIRGLVVKNNSRRILLRGMKGTIGAGPSKGTVFVEADSGVIMNMLVRYTIEEGLSGLEMHLGLPGTVGGAVYMNSKWTHPEGYVGDAVYQATILTPGGEIKVVPRSYFNFAYDTSSIQKSKDIVLSVVFALSPQKSDVLWNTANGSMDYRRNSQPQGVASLGCTFQNLSKADAFALQTPGHTTSAGYLVDHAGLKGKQIGDAQISTFHANFIINLGHATAHDVIELIELARHEVHKQFGVKLKEEIVRLGEF